MNKINTEPYIATYLHAKGRTLGLPIAGNFELTARCNFNCPMCYVHQSAATIDAMGEELSAPKWLEIASAAQKKGMIFVLLTGGEPLMRRDFFEIYDGLKKLGLMISINTNGSVMDGETLERFIKDPPIRFNISLYGGSNETYKNMCGLAVYDKVKDNIRVLRKAGVPVSLNLSITQYNAGDLEQIYADAVALDVNVKASSYMYPPVRINGEAYGSGNRLCAEEAARYSVLWDKLRFTEEEFTRRAKNMANLIDDNRVNCSVETNEGVGCRAGSTSFWVTWRGEMLPCGMMTKPVAYPLTEGFDVAWEKLRKMTAEIRTPAACQSCEYRDVCGVCAAVCYTETGTFDGVPTYVCKKTMRQVELTKG